MVFNSLQEPVGPVYTLTQPQLYGTSYFFVKITLLGHSHDKIRFSMKDRKVSSLHLSHKFSSLHLQKGTREMLLVEARFSHTYLFTSQR